MLLEASMSVWWGWGQGEMVDGEKESYIVLIRSPGNLVGVVREDGG